VTGVDRIEIRIGGVGGQGIALAGTLLGKAAAVYDGREAVFTQTYGPEARGGAARADIIISDSPIAYPFVSRPDMLIVLFQEAYEKFRSNLGTGGLLLLESSLVTPRAEDADAIGLPAIEIATELGNKLAANLVLLGYLVGATDVVSRNAMEDAIHEMVDERHLDLDMQAFGAGVDLAARAGGD
jgi:2-oxoglutarate ferredoxin oxidoreductase subunit gamma